MITEPELLKFQKRGQFADEPVRIKDTQINYVTSQVLTTVDIEEMQSWVIMLFINR
jgi:hypothetical protein